MLVTLKLVPPVDQPPWGYFILRELVWGEKSFGEENSGETVAREESPPLVPPPYLTKNKNKNKLNFSKLWQK